MNLPKDKRNQFVITVGVTLGVLVGLWFGLIHFQQLKLKAIADARASADRKCAMMENAIKNAGQVEADLAESGAKLKALEAGMASGDLYSWVINKIREFKQPYKVEIPQFSQIDGPRDMTLLPGFPYKQATITVGGSAYFHDFGRFVADFENAFPYFRVLNLTLEPYTAMNSTDKEKLSFRMDIVVLVKPEAS